MRVLEGESAKTFTGWSGGFSRSLECNMYLDSWRQDSLPDIQRIANEWKQLDPQAAPDAVLMDGMRKLAVEDASYWGTDSHRR